MTGKLIVIDGTDGSGKGTQTQLLIERLKKEGYDVAYYDFPRHGEPSCAMVDEYLNGKFGTASEVDPYVGSVFYAVDRYAASFDMKKDIAAGKIVVCNRYVSANQGHQAGKIKDLAARDKYLEWLDNLEFEMFKIPRPDINILLFVHPALNQALVDKKESRNYLNGKKRDIHENDINHLHDAANAFVYCAEKFNWIILNCSDGDAILSREEIHELLWNETMKRLEKLHKKEDNHPEE